MSQNEIWNPMGERVDSLSAKERQDVERAQAWAYYVNSGGLAGDPAYFDAMTWLRNKERQR
jgi:hypothetical protein